MIRSTKTSLKFSRIKKLYSLHLFIEEYRNVVSKFIDLLWEQKDVKCLIPKEQTSLISSWISKRAIQCAAKQASAIVRGTKQKQKQRQFIIKKLQSEGKDSSKLQKLYDTVQTTKPNVNQIEPELDSRFVKICLENETTFDGWITLSSIGNSLKIEIPFKKHKHFNKMLSKGKIKSGIRLSKKMITFMFDIEDIKPKTVGSLIGIDVGLKSTLSCSNGQVIQQDNHGHDYFSICKCLSKKRKGSKGFRKVETHRTNYINWTINQLNLKDVKEVNREEIKNLRKGKRNTRLMQSWNYGELFDVMDRKLSEQGVLVNLLHPTYTSQRCSSCGWVRKGNRSGKLFKCDKCFFEYDADLNAAINLSLKLKPIGKQQRLKQENRTGFYWNVLDQELIVPECPTKTKNLILS